ncbi:MAG: hypothetical protein U1F57_01765 [bacterium]
MKNKLKNIFVGSVYVAAWMASVLLLKPVLAYEKPALPERSVVQTLDGSEDGSPVTEERIFKSAIKGEGDINNITCSICGEVCKQTGDGGWQCYPVPCCK